MQQCLRRDLPYSPHITLARNASFPLLETAFEEARDEFGAELDDLLRSVSLLSVERNGKITRLREISLDTS